VLLSLEEVFRDWDLLEAVIIKGIPHKAGFQWQFVGAFYFCTGVVTTVGEARERRGEMQRCGSGYGHSTPETTSGKLFCMLFAIAGIPLGLIMFQSIGERVNTGIAFVLNKVSLNSITNPFIASRLPSISWC